MTDDELDKPDVDAAPDEEPTLDKPDSTPRSSPAWDLLVTLDDIKAIEAAFEKAGMEIPASLGEVMEYTKGMLTMLESFSAR